MLYPQHGDRIVNIDYVTSFHSIIKGEVNVGVEVKVTYQGQHWSEVHTIANCCTRVCLLTLPAQQGVCNGRVSLRPSVSPPVCPVNR